MSAGLRAAGAASLRPRWATPVSLGALAVLFVALAACDVAGLFSGIDQFAVSHLMPALRPGPPSAQAFWTGLYDPFGRAAPRWEKVLDLWVYPCSVLISGIVVAAIALVLARRRDRRTALALVFCWVAGNLFELVCKASLHRPALYTTFDGRRYHLGAYDGSFPSGHMIRGIVVVFALGALWPRARCAAVAWFAPVGPMLVANAAHTPSDVLGGLVAGLTLVGVAAFLAERSAPRIAAPSDCRRG